MADTPDTPPATNDQPAPAPRRRAPRQTAAKAEGAAPKRTRRTAPKPAAEDTGVIAKVEEGAASAAKSVRTAASRTASKTGEAVSDTARKASDAVTGTARKTGDAVTGTARKAANAVKPRSTKRATPRSPAKGRGKAAAQRSTLDKATDKVGGRWGAAAIAGGLAAAGAAAAALLSLRSSTPKADAPTKGKGAHQPDGTDSSKSFQAGIADENTVPNS
jgi:hypothetical protein